MDSFSILRSVWGVSLAVFFFGFTIFVHELGHFLAAKKRGLKVERFSIGFGPRIWGWTGKDGVDYRLSLFPLGGYVALPQMADMSAVEGSNEDDPDRLPKIGYADKMIVAVMGATFNILFAIVLACILAVFGRPEPVGDRVPVIGYISTDVSLTPGGARVESPASRSGLLLGDRILRVDGAPVQSFHEVRSAVALGTGRDETGPVVSFEIEREGKVLPKPVMVRPVVADASGNGDTLRMVGISGFQPVFVDVDGNPTAPAARAGMKTGDRIASVNGVDILSLEHFREYLAAAGERPMNVVVERADGDTLSRIPLVVTPEFVTISRPLLALEFNESGEKRRVELVPVPEFPATADPKTSPRTKLMVREGLSPDSEYADVLRTGNILTAVSGKGMVQNTANFDAVIAEAKNQSADRPLSLYFNDDNVSLRGASFSVVPAESSPYIGIAVLNKMENVRRAPWVFLGETFSSTFSTLKALLSPGSDVNVKHLTGVIGISRIYYGVSENMLLVLWFTLVLNVNLAIMNLLPLPVLDGGHMVYATLEKIRGRALPRRVVEVVQTTFVLVFFGLMAFVVYRDLMRLSADSSFERRYAIEQFVAVEPVFSSGKPAATATPSK